jgi:hypothetical protein
MDFLMLLLVVEVVAVELAHLMLAIWVVLEVVHMTQARHSFLVVLGAILLEQMVQTVAM